MKVLVGSNNYVKLMKTIKWFTFALLVVLLSCEINSDIPDGCVDPTKKTNGPCTYVLIPVCGCNGSTYGNACEAQAAGVQNWTEGECGK
jgi:hypothetical protein